MGKTFIVNRYKSSTLLVSYISRVLEVILLLFFSIFLLGPAVFFILNGLFCGMLFLRPHWQFAYRIFKTIFRASDQDFFMVETPASLWFWVSRMLMTLLVIGQIGLGIHFLIQYGFLEQNLIYIILNLDPIPGQ